MEEERAAHEYAAHKRYKYRNDILYPQGVRLFLHNGHRTGIPCRRINIEPECNAGLMDEGMTRMKLRENDKGTTLGADVGIGYRRNRQREADVTVITRREKYTEKRAKKAHAADATWVPVQAE